MIVNMSKKDLNQLAYKIRADVLDMAFHAGVEGGHIGGAFSSAEILAVLYGEIMNVDPKNPTKADRDRFILSKGHISIAHYAVLKECGFLTQEDLAVFERNGSGFSTHETENMDKGIEITSGSLGYGVSIGIGCALAAKRKRMDYKTYVLAGDGECNEGCVWEAAMTGARYGLDNLIVIIDKNDQQLDGYTGDIMPVDDFEKVFEGFGWAVRKVDGHNVNQLRSAFMDARENKPLAVIAQTVKGKGIERIEGQTGWHHAQINDTQYEQFKKSLEETKCWK